MGKRRSEGGGGTAEWGRDDLKEGGTTGWERGGGGTAGWGRDDQKEVQQDGEGEEGGTQDGEENDQKEEVHRMGEETIRRRRRYSRMGTRRSEEE